MPSFSAALSGFNTSTGPSRVREEPIEGNSLIKFLRSSFNDLSRTGQNAMDTGQNLFQTGVRGFSQPADYWEKILSGDQKTMSSAIAPTANVISKNYQQAGESARRNLPRGGYSSILQAELPFRKSAEINNYAMQLQPMAAQQLQQISAQLSQLGLSEQQIGTIIRSLVVQGQLGVRGQDVGEHNAAMGLAGSLASTAMGGFGSIYGTNVMAGARP